ncbi:MAG: L-seryl-tRNA(Sec) selenium transferase [Planctomycetes bacterium]|nr:L-seryl-tRNA(Sec) selenium transferase [Planctomycetota bacterium]
MSRSDNPLRRLPSVTQILDTDAIKELQTRHAHDLIVDAIRAELQVIRVKVLDGESRNGAPGAEAIALRVQNRLRVDLQPRLRSVINATGIVLHTNLGRAPIAEEAAKAAYDAARGYLNLELDLDTGKRSSRQDPIREWITRLTGAESATVVNNNAAATVIALRTLTLTPGPSPGGRGEVIVSRGQLIEIGGSFRIPEIMAVSGATLREVGATNITRLSDYEKAIGPQTAALMQIHTSNYRIAGFTQSVTTEELVTLGKKHNLPVIDDIGSGALLDFNRFGFTGEPIARASVAAGADLVLFSGDKLLGGPQAGILAGRKELIQRIEKDPLMRAFRCDKMTLAALEATLRIYLNEDAALRDIPVLRLLSMTSEELKTRAEDLASRLTALGSLESVAMAEDVAYVGGGSLPDQTMRTWIVEVKPQTLSDAEFAQRLRLGAPAVMARVRDGKIVFDVRTIFPDQIDSLVQAVKLCGMCGMPANP